MLEISYKPAGQLIDLNLVPCVPIASSLQRTHFQTHLSDHHAGLIYMPQLPGNQFVAKHFGNQCIIFLSIFPKKREKKQIHLFRSVF